jgi:DNA-binding GntR family transcriptional regulator
VTQTDAKPSGRGSARPASAIQDHPNLKDVAESFISEGIVSGSLEPGAKVDQDEIAGILGISRLPVREALIELAQKGFVTAVPRRGAFVSELGPDDIEDHFEVLGMAFALASRRAAKRLSPEQVADLKSIHAEIDASDDLAAKVLLNREFFQIINHAGCSNRLLSIVTFLSGALPARYYLSSTTWAATEDSFRAPMLAAMEAKDAVTAGKVAFEHLHTCGQVTIEELRARGYWTDEDA